MGGHVGVDELFVRILRDSAGAGPQSTAGQFAARKIRVPRGCSADALCQWVALAVAARDAEDSEVDDDHGDSHVNDTQNAMLLDASGRAVESAEQITPGSILTFLRPAEAARSRELFGVAASPDLNISSSRLWHNDVKVSQELQRSLALTRSISAGLERWGSVPPKRQHPQEGGAAQQADAADYSWTPGDIDLMDDVVVVSDDNTVPVSDAELASLDDVADETAVSASPQLPANLRSPVVCVLGHVDAGKTSLLDRIRRSTVQAGEAGGITQQIGATMIPIDTIREQTAAVNDNRFTLSLPGLVVIDTPGHSSFTNLRTRGSGLCDIAILVVDIKHGLRPQTIESLQILHRRQTPFIIALNKVDRLNGWETEENRPIRDCLKAQSPETLEDFRACLRTVMDQLRETMSLNSTLYWRCRDFTAGAAIVPTSAQTGEGMCDIELLLVLMAQKHLQNRLTPGAMLPPFFQGSDGLPTADPTQEWLEKSRRPVSCTVLDVRMLPSIGPCIDVILLEGYLKDDDRILISGLDGPIVAKIRKLISPALLSDTKAMSRESRRGDQTTSQVSGVCGVKIHARGLERAIAGSQLIVLSKNEDPAKYHDEIMTDLNSVLGGQRSPLGVAVHASTIGSLEALLDFLTDHDVPVSSVKIGPVQKNDVTKASSRQRVYSAVLAFDTSVTAPALRAAETHSVDVYQSDVIYRLFQDWSAHVKRWGGYGMEVDPCIMRIRPEFLFNSASPLVLTVEVRGNLSLHTLLTIPYKDRPWLDLGRVIAIRDISSATPLNRVGHGAIVTIKIATKADKVTGRTVILGRDFDFEDMIFSRCPDLDSMAESMRNINTPFMRHYRDALGLPKIKRKPSRRERNRAEENGDDANWW